MSRGPVFWVFIAMGLIFGSMVIFETRMSTWMSSFASSINEGIGNSNTVLVKDDSNIDTGNLRDAKDKSKSDGEAKLNEIANLDKNKGDENLKEKEILKVSHEVEKKALEKEKGKNKEKDTETAKREKEAAEKLKKEKVDKKDKIEKEKEKQKDNIVRSKADFGDYLTYSDRVVDMDYFNHYSSIETDAQDSSYFCHSEDHAIDHERRRACRFRNLCVIPEESAFQGLKWMFLSEDSQEKVVFTAGTGPHTSAPELMVRPEIMTKEKFSSQYPKYRIFKKKSILFYEYNGENFGHVLSDQMMPMYFLQRSFADQADREIQLFDYIVQPPISWSCAYMSVDPSWKRVAWDHCPVLRRSLFPSLVNNAPMPLGRHSERFFKLDSEPEKPIPLCFDDISAGMMAYSDDCLEGSHGRIPDRWTSCNHGKQGIFWDFRKFLIEGSGADTTIVPTKLRVTVWNSNPKRRVEGVEDIMKKIQEKFNVEVVYVDFAKMSFKDQIEEMLKTTLHITSPGGGSFITMFLPRGASTIRLFKNELYLEHHFFPYLGYISVSEVDCTGNGHTVSFDVLSPLIVSAFKRYRAFGHPLEESVSNRRTLAALDLENE